MAFTLYYSLFIHHQYLFLQAKLLVKFLSIIFCKESTTLVLKTNLTSKKSMCVLGELNITEGSFQHR